MILDLCMFCLGSLQKATRKNARPLLPGRRCRLPAIETCPTHHNKGYHQVRPEIFMDSKEKRLHLRSLEHSVPGPCQDPFRPLFETIETDGYQVNARARNRKGNSWKMRTVDTHNIQHCFCFAVSILRRLKSQTLQSPKQKPSNPSPGNRCPQSLPNIPKPKHQTSCTLRPQNQPQCLHVENSLLESETCEACGTVGGARTAFCMSKHGNF